MNYQTIPRLAPFGLDRVPDYTPDDDRDPHADRRWRLAWFAWRDRMEAHRRRVVEACRQNPRLWAVERKYCREDPAYFIAMYLWIEEPRPRRGEQQVKPFTPFGFQVELARAVADVMEMPEQVDILISKARGLGATWIVTAIMLWGWLFRDWRSKLVSRKEEYVDRPLDIDSMFGRIDFMIEHLPGELLPTGLVMQTSNGGGKRHRNHNMLKHPASSSQITGESTTNKTARGARATGIVYDESGFMPGFKSVWGTGGGTTDHRIGLSSENPEAEGEEWERVWKKAAKGQGGRSPAEVVAAIKERIKRDTELWERAKKRWGAQEEFNDLEDEAPDDYERFTVVFELDYYLNPYFDARWRKREEARLEEQDDPHGFAREYLRNRRAGKSTYIYPEAEKIEFLDRVKYDPGLVLLVGIDPGMADPTAIIFCQLKTGDRQREMRLLDSYQNHRVPAEFYAHILTGILPERGDVCWPLTHMFGAREREIMTWMHGVPNHAARFFFDPAGKQTDASGLSFIDRVVIESRKLRRREWEKEIAKLQKQGTRKGKEVQASELPPKPTAIRALYEELYAKNRFDIRHLGAREFLPICVAANTDGARELVTQLTLHKYGEASPRSVNEPGVLHSEASHLASAFEFLCQYARMGYARPRKARRVEHEEAA